MLILISPAKTLDYDTPAVTKSKSQPVLLDESQILIDELQKLTPGKVSSLMNISEKLGNLNFERFMDWQRPFNTKNAKQAVLAFKGDVYTGLDAESLSEDELKFAQQHLRILSGLYGVLRPLDLMQPYRLEMGTKFKNPKGKDLYQFWGTQITDELNKQLKKLKSELVINLASNEYFKSVDKKALNAEIITPAFKDLKNGNYKIISFFAKKARGLMTRWIIENNISDPADLKKFKVAGYKYNAKMSTRTEPVFTRDTPQ